MALRRILWQPNDLGVSRVYVAGEKEVDGDSWSLSRLHIAGNKARKATRGIVVIK